MFLVRRPSTAEIGRFLEDSAGLPVSYEPIGLVSEQRVDRRCAEEVVMIGRGDVDFARACDALSTWKQFEIGWVELFPRPAASAVGTVVAVVIHHLGFWSMNGCRVVYHVGDRVSGRFGIAYGTLTNHAESGEELFEVVIDHATGDVMYRIRAISWPQAMLARLGQSLVRTLQSRFRTDSGGAMKRAVKG